MNTQSLNVLWLPAQVKSVGHNEKGHFQVGDGLLWTIDDEKTVKPAILAGSLYFTGYYWKSKWWRWRESNPYLH